MKREKDLILKTTMEIKVFLLFLLDNIVGPIDRTALIDIVEENTDEISFDYDECLRQLTESEHVYRDEIGSESYYMISEKGRMVAAELYDSLDPDLRERSIRSAIRHTAQTESERSVKAYITETPERRYRVTMIASDRFGEVMSVSVTVSSKSEAESIKSGYLKKPDSVYRGVFFSVTGKMEYIS